MTKICIHSFISGHVQGVFYRSSAQKKARSLGIVGWARNLSDGRVEVFACGEETQVQTFQEWLWQGPIAAKVTEVQSQQASVQPYEGFEVL